MLGQQAGIRRVARVQAQVETLATRNDVEMDVKDALPGRSAVQLRDEYAGCVERLLDRTSDSLRGDSERRERLRGDLENGLGFGLRDDQRVAVRLRHQVHERERERILVHAVSRELAAQDARKDVVAVVGHRVTGPVVCEYSEPGPSSAVRARSPASMLVSATARAPSSRPYPPSGR